ncbi:RNA-directed DNA polymerase, eukaryota [Tanacetum coccineum]
MCHVETDVTLLARARPTPSRVDVTYIDKSSGCSSRIAESSQRVDDHLSSRPNHNDQKIKKGVSMLDILEEMIKVGQTMGFTMEGCSKDMEKIIGLQGVDDERITKKRTKNKAKTTKLNTEWKSCKGQSQSKAKDQKSQSQSQLNKLTVKTGAETKSDSISDMVVKNIWGNSNFDISVSEAVGNSGGLLCVWDPNTFYKEQHVISDNFIALYGTWRPNLTKMLLIFVYAPQAASLKRALWAYLSSLINRWNGECIVMGDFNEVRRKEDRWGTLFNVYGARAFNQFIATAGLVEIQLEGYNYTWAHPSASKMSKLDRFLVSDGLLSVFPHISAVCLDKHLSDHRPILLREVIIDYGAIPFRLFHSWFEFLGFDTMVIQTWNSIILNDNNGMIRFKKKLQILKRAIRAWIDNRKKSQMNTAQNIRSKLRDIDIKLDQGDVNEDLLLSRTDLMNQLHEVKSTETCEFIQKAKIKWAVEGDENTKFFHGIVNRKRANLAVKGVMIDGDWIDDPKRVKDEFRDHFASRFNEPGPRLGHISFPFPNRLNDDQSADLETPITRDEIRLAVWGCGENKSPGPDGFTFEFFRKFWFVIGPDFCTAVEWFFEHASFPIGCNSSFIALIPKTLDPMSVSDYRPISLIGCLYKVVTKILAQRLSTVISDLVSDVQTAFLPNRQILDGPFIINELLARCHHKKQRAMFFKVDFAKAYDSIRWDYLESVLNSFGFGLKWRSWIRGSLNSSMASILVNGSPTTEFQFHRGLKQGDPLAPYLFILVMESLHLSFSRVIEAGLFTGIQIDSSVTLSHLFYADDAIFIGKWNSDNLKCITHMLRWFSLLSGLSINLKKSQLLGVGMSDNIVTEAAISIGCSVLRTPFVPPHSNIWELWSALKTLSIGGRLTLLKLVLDSTPIYNMSLYKVPKTVLSSMEAIRRNFFNGYFGIGERKGRIAWVKWTKVLALKEMEV